MVWKLGYGMPRKMADKRSGIPVHRKIVHLKLYKMAVVYIRHLQMFSTSSRGICLIYR